ncbi:MAG: DEAD/DEAH box helicase [Oscillospiraceae bacterium]|nr:DEAD/DEAH box helicase [Oscillospiraceae bacterium]
MKYSPRRHQVLAERWLREHERCALFLDMGLGKTVVTLTVLRERIYEDFSVDRALVIAPKNVAEDTWTREQEKWDHLSDLRVAKLLGTAAQRRRALASCADVDVINRENVQWLVEELGGRWPYDMVVIDELSSFKSSHAKRWRMLKRVIGQSRYVVGLTGTPAPKGYLDLWPEIFLIDGGERLDRSITRFRERYFNPGRRNGHIVYDWRLKPGAKEEIDRRLADICLSMSAEDWLDLPELMLNRVTVRLDKKERAVYDQFKRDHVLPLLDGKLSALENMDAAVVGETAAAVSNKLLQMSNGRVYEDGGNVFRIHERKLDALEQIAEAGKNMLVFYAFKHDLAAIRERFPDAVEIRDGSVAENIRRWNDGQIPMLLCHPASAGHGLNLQEGGHLAVWYGLTWSLELYQQANARLHRQGQTERVIIHHILAEGTMDARVMDALEKKDVTQRSLLAALKEEMT